MNPNYPIVVALALFAFPAEAAGDPLTLTEIVEKVRVNERLYDNIEVVHRVDYKHGDAPPWQGNPQIDPVVSSTSHSRTVFQGGMHFLKQDREQSLVSGRIQQIPTVQGYDGEKTRMFEQNAFGNVHEGRVEDARLFRPHTILMSENWAFPHRRLSDFLSAGEYHGQQTFWSVVAEEEIGDLRCYRVRLETAASKKVLASKGPLLRLDLWLAYERNYLIVQLRTWRSWTAGLEEEPYCTARITTLEKIGPGIWFPLDARSDALDTELLYGEGKKVTANTIKWKTEKVKLNPAYEKSLFRDIAFPPNTVVYEVKDGKIVK